MKTVFRIFRVLPAALLVLWAASCSGGLDDGQSGTAPELSFKTNPVSPAGGTQLVTVTASSSWTITVTGEGEWLKFSPASGTGNNGLVKLEYSTNTAEAARTVTVIIASGTKNNKYTFTQNGTSSSTHIPDEEPTDVEVTSTAKVDWLELPETGKGDNYAFFTHYMTVGSTVKRNYSFYWSKSDMVSIWVAYPMNSTLIGSGSRPDPEPWAKDPLLEAAGIAQPDVTYTFKGYTRGHQIASADRYVGNGNAQTYYSSNMTPQLWEFNGDIWASLEGRMRNWSKTAGTDTCYVVTGCVVDGKSKTLCNDGTSVSVPKSYFKAILRHTKAATVGFGGYSALGILLQHKDYAPVENPTKDMFISIDELEKQLGIDLFVNLPAKVGDDMAAKIEAEDPQSSTVWW